MFIHLPGQTTLGVVPDQVVAVIESINAPAIGTPIGTEKTKAYIERYEQVMRGNSEAFGSRLDRGWVPPALEDVAAEQESAGAD